LFLGWISARRVQKRHKQLAWNKFMSKTYNKIVEKNENQIKTNKTKQLFPPLNSLSCFVCLGGFSACSFGPYG
jgi:ribosomal protein L4